MIFNRESDFWGYYVDFYRLLLFLAFLVWSAFIVVEWFHGESPITWRSFGLIVAFFVAVALRPRLASPGLSDTAHPLGDNRSKYRITVIAILAFSGIPMGFASPIDFETLSQVQDMAVSALIYAGLLALLAWLYCLLRPITMP